MLHFFKFVRLSYCSVFFCCCTVDVLHVQLLAGTTFKSKNGDLSVLCSSLQFRRKWLLPYIFTLCQSSDAVSSEPNYDLCSVPVAFAVWMFSCPGSESAVCTVFTQLCCSVKLNCCVYFYISVYSSVGDGTHSLCLRLYTLGADTRVIVT